jgi:hypothetical protein
MSGRITPLSPPALFTALLASFLAARDVHAHRLDAQVFILPNQKVQVESWFSDGDPAKGAKVQVFGAQEQFIAEGHLNEQGVFVFSCGEVPPRTVVISAGAGHRKVVSLPAGGAKEDSPAPLPLAERDSGGPVKDVLVGVGFLLALAGFVLSVRNAQKLRALGRPSEKAQ